MHDTTSRERAPTSFQSRTNVMTRNRPHSSRNVHIWCPASQWLVLQRKRRKKELAIKDACVERHLETSLADVLEVWEDEERYHEQNQGDDAASEVNVAQDHCSADLLSHTNVSQKTAPFYFCNNFVKQRSFTNSFWHTYSWINFLSPAYFILFINQKLGTNLRFIFIYFLADQVIWQTIIIYDGFKWRR